jgi:glycosyltransferase involved in cell wall biosynthesis
MMATKTRILHVLGGLNRGGAETMVMNLYRFIDKSKIQFDFIVHTTDKCDYDDEIHELGGKIYHIPRYTGKNHYLYKKVWRNFFQKHPEYQIIHGHMRSTASIYLRIAKQYGLTTIAHSHSTSSGTGFSAIVKNLLQYPIRYIADYLFACSYNAGMWLFGKKACQKDNFFIVNNAIDTKKFIYDKNKREKKRKEFRIEDKFVVGHVGRFHTSKNHQFIVDIFKEVHDRNSNTVLVLVGDGELRQSIENKVQELGLENSVIFTGVRSDIPEIFQAFDVFVLPSLYEGLGMVAIEAQATGLPCIVADTIPKEAFVTDLIHVLSLKESKNHWVNKILELAESSNKKRINTYEQIKLRGYDIKETSEWLEKFYLINLKKGSKTYV